MFLLLLIKMNTCLTNPLSSFRSLSFFLFQTYKIVLPSYSCTHVYLHSVSELPSFYFCTNIRSTLQSTPVTNGNAHPYLLRLQKSPLCLYTLSKDPLLFYLINLSYQRINLVLLTTSYPMNFIYRISDSSISTLS